MRKKVTFFTDKGVLQVLKASLENNNVSITSTDTILGFLAPLTASGVQKLNDLKGDRQGKTYILLIASQDKLSAFVDMTTIDERIQKIMDTYWPGPLTIVFKAKQGLAKHLVAADNTVALRCPQHEELRNLLASFDGLLSTSVNKSGQAPALTVDQIPEDILSNVDCVVVDENRVSVQGKPSTIIDVSKSGEIRVLRQGALVVDDM